MELKGKTCQKQKAEYDTSTQQLSIHSKHLNLGRKVTNLIINPTITILHIFVAPFLDGPLSRI